MVRQFVYGIRIDEVVQMRSAAGAVHYYHSNSIGSIAALTDDQGLVAEKYEYRAYGEAIITDSGGNALSRSALGNPYGFTGRRIDSRTGLYYYRARHYSAATGRFLQRDPMGYIDGMGLYAYAANNPVNFVDPFGLMSCEGIDDPDERQECSDDREEFNSCMQACLSHPGSTFTMAAGGAALAQAPHPAAKLAGFAVAVTPPVICAVAVCPVSEDEDPTPEGPPAPDGSPAPDGPPTPQDSSSASGENGQSGVSENGANENGGDTASRQK